MSSLRFSIYLTRTKVRAAVTTQATARTESLTALYLKECTASPLIKQTTLHSIFNTGRIRPLETTQR